MTHATPRRMMIGEPTAVATARAVLEAGGLLLIPTDTVYGVACLPTDAAAIERLYVAKGRPAEKAIQVLLADTLEARRVAEGFPSSARTLANTFWPGGLTLTLPKKTDAVAPNLSPYTTVAVRVPNHAPLRGLLHALGGALAASSANLSGQPPATTLDEALAVLGAHVGLALDGGPTPGPVASTVVETTLGGEVRILRAGTIPEAAILAALSAAGQA